MLDIIFSVNMAFLVISFSYAVTLLAFFFGKRRVKSTQNTLFGYLLIINIVAILMEAFCVMSSVLFEVDSFMNLLVNKTFLVIIVINMALILLYVTNLVDLSDGISVNTKKKLQKYLKIIIISVSVVCSISLYFLDIKFFNSDGKMYSYGPAVNVLFVIIFSTLIFCSVYLLATTKTSAANRKRNVPVFAFLIGFLICALIQKKFPHITLSNSVVTFIDLLIYHSIENPMFNELAIAKNVATEATSAKKDFLSSMSHEIRTPLNAIVGLSQMIKEDENTPELDKDADEIFVASHTLLDIIDSILDANSISANQIEIENKDYTLSEELNNVTHIIDVMLINKNIKLEKNYASDLPVILNGDIHKIKRILNNILTNAVKYTNEGTINFNVSCVNKTDTSTLIFEIKDTGRGMSEDQIEKLFNQFYRLDIDKDSDISGVGLGLAITKSFVDIMNGKIDVNSRLGEGTTFRIEIPQKIVKIKNIEIEEL